MILISFFTAFLLSTIMVSINGEETRTPLINARIIPGREIVAPISTDKNTEMAKRSIWNYYEGGRQYRPRSTVRTTTQQPSYPSVDEALNALLQALDDLLEELSKPLDYITRISIRNDSKKSLLDQIIDWIKKFFSTSMRGYQSTLIDLFEDITYQIIQIQAGLQRSLESSDMKQLDPGSMQPPPSPGAPSDGLSTLLIVVQMVMKIIQVIAGV